ncbi:MAG TPA: GTP cyclohydrolase I [Vicinamibacteria bacterium]|jgi:GTP cyclohydrolase I
MRRGRKRPPEAPDVPAVERAIRDLLRGAGVEIEGTDLEQTPERVAKAWTESFLDGYRSDPEALFSKTYPVPTGPKSTVLLKAIPFFGLCPHHLLPFYGKAHVAYLPGRKLASLSSLARLVDVYAHRLEIQETVTRQIAKALMKYLKADGAAVALETDQLCLTMRHPDRKGSRTVTQHFEGAFAKKSALRLEFLKSLETFE